MENNVILYGASGHAKVIIDILLSNNVMIDHIIDDNPKTITLLGKPVLKTSDFDLDGLQNTIIAIGNNQIRKKISNQLKTKFSKAIHPTAIVSPFTEIGEGTVLMANSVVNPDVIIGKHCIVNTGAILEHDCKIADFVHISPAVSLAGNITIGEGAHIGIGATIIQGITVGKWATVGAGSVIIRDVPDYAVVVGNPGKVIKYNQ